MFSLAFLDSGTSRVERLRDGLTVLGRAPACDVVISHPTVSRQHARIRFEAGRCFVVDAGSRYGTRINGVPVDGERELVAGDVLTVGAVGITVEQRVAERELLSEGHQLVEDAETLVRRAAGTAVDAPPISSPGERRKAGDRRGADMGRAAGERRSGRERRGGRYLKLLTGIANTLVTVQPVGEMLGRVVDLAFDVVPAERVFLLLRDNPDEPLAARVMRHRDRSVPGRASLSRTVVNRVMRERVALLASDALLDQRSDSAQDGSAMSVRSFMCAPLWNRNDVIGVMYCDSPRSKPFSREDLDVFLAFCGYAGVAIGQARLSAQLMEELKRRERLQRYLAPAVVNRVVHGGTGTDAPFLVQKRDVTVMFCCLIGFGRSSERRAPLELASFLNTFLTRMGDVIFEHEGTLDRFVGDGILAVFGAPFDQPDHAARAVAAARDMRRALATLNAEPGASPAQLRIALNSGRATTGEIGSPRRREFTVLGDVVETALRVAAAGGPDQVLMTQSTWTQVKDTFKTRSIGNDLYELTV